jgi:hypothetical protein
MKRLVAAAALMASVGCLDGAAPPKPGPADFQAIVRDLGSSDFTVREAAQGRLNGLPMDVHDALVDQARTTGDPEVQARLRARVDEIELAQVIDPPSISLHIKNAKDEEMVKALGKAVGVPLTLYQEQREARYTLDVEEKPYWDVYRALALQYPVMLHATYWSNDVLAQIAKLGNAARIERHGGVTLIAAVGLYEERLFAGSRMREAPIPADSRKMSVLFAYVVDPRIHLLEYRSPLIGSVVDESGKVMAQRDVGTQTDSPNLGECTWREQLDLVVPKQGGSRALSIKGEVRVLVPLKSETKEIDDLEQQVGKTFVVSGRSYALNMLKISQQPRDGHYDASIDLDAEDREGAAPVEVAVVDQNGERIFSGVVTKGLKEGIASGAPIARPLKLVVTTAVQKRDWRIPFELKGIPVPP